MAQKSRTQLVSDSDSTFLDNNTGQIIPANHRQFNDDMIESNANVTESNTFEEIQYFNKDIRSNAPSGTFSFYSENGDVQLDNGKVQAPFGDLRLLKMGYASNTITLNEPNCYLTNAEGNFVFVEPNGYNIEVFVGNQLGVVYYITFLSETIIGSSGHISPQANFKIYSGDTLVVVNQDGYSNFRILNLYRNCNNIGDGYPYNSLNYFTINVLSELYNLIQNKALVIGATYRINEAYANGDVLYNGSYFDVFVVATSNLSISQNCYLYQVNGGGGNGGEIKIKAFINSNADLNQSAFLIGDILIIEEVDKQNGNSINFDKLSNNTSYQIFDTQSSIICNDYGVRDFVGRINFDESGAPQKRNILDLTDATKMPFGSIMYDLSNNAEKFYPHSGTIASWGMAYPSGLTAGDIEGFNSGMTTTAVYGTYIIVNNICTINVMVDIEVAFNGGWNGRTSFFQFPLPFMQDISNANVVGVGNGSITWKGINNHETIGLNIPPSYWNYGINIEASWNSPINTPTPIQASFTYMYKIDPFILN